MPTHVGYPRVGIEPESLVGRYAEYHTRARQRPIGAVGSDRRRMNLFVENELLIDGRDRELAEELRERYGAELVEEPPIPPPPKEMEGRRPEIDPRSIPRTTRLRFAAPPPVEGIDELLGRRIGVRGAAASSPMAAAVAALAEKYGGGRRGTVGLNFVGEPFAMPLTTIAEGNNASNPLNVSCFTSDARLADAWQVIDSIRQVRGDSMVWIAILDEGFWLDGNGVPNVSTAEPVSDFGPGVMQFNLIAEGQPVGGPTTLGYAWHGNAVASIAAGAMNNASGTAGAAGNTARPIFFRSDLDIYQMMRCAKMCAAWGIDVLNFSNGTWGQSEFWFPTSQWDEAFQFAADNRVVIVAAAGNSNWDLPDDQNVRPATRTPGVLTVGALGADNKGAWGNSNYGSSVGLWAPGTNIPRAPDGMFANGSFAPAATSYAAPIVSGVAAMMRYANPQLDAHQIRTILIQTAWAGQGRVTRGLNAYEAVMRAIQHTLPDNQEPNNTPQTARDLIAVGPGGALVPTIGVFTAKASATDPEYWKFTVSEVSTVTVLAEWYERISSLSVNLETDDEEAIGIAGMTRTGDAFSGAQTLTGVLGPAQYRVRIGGNAATAYRLLVTIKASNLPRDIFEPNDSFEHAARLIFEPRPLSQFIRREWGPGTYDATLHRDPPIADGLAGFINSDYFLLEVPDASTVFHIPEVSIADADVPLDVTLYDAARNQIGHWSGVRKMSAQPPGNSICYLKVTGAKVSRYRISTRITYDSDAVPGPQQRPFEVLPEWWFAADPVWLRDPEHHVIVEVSTNPAAGDAIVFESAGDPAEVEILDRAGEVVRRGEADAGHVSVSTEGLATGPYVLRFRREAASAVPSRMSRVPPLR